MRSLSYLHPVRQSLPFKGLLLSESHSYGDELVRDSLVVFFHLYVSRRVRPDDFSFSPLPAGELISIYLSNPFFC